MKKIIGIVIIIAMMFSFPFVLSSCNMKGIKGDRGAQGEKGEKGDDGASIKEIEYDECGRLVITLTDGTVLEPVEIPEKSPHTHDFSEWYIIAESSCIKSGLKLQYCLTCGDTKTAVIESSNSLHQYNSIVTMPTCSDGGYTPHTCTICNYSFEDSYTDMLSCQEYQDCPHLTEQTYVAFGDSITYGVDGTLDKWGLMPDPYPQLVGGLLGLKSVQNKAISGATLCSNSGRTNMTENILAFSGEADIISVMLGVNDYAMNMPLGNSNSRENDTIYGSLFMIAEHLTTNYSDSLVFFITPFPTTKSGGNGKYTVADVADAVKYVAAMYGLPVLDLYTHGKYELEMVLSTNDGIHPSQEHFRTYTAPQVAEFIERHWKTEDESQSQNYVYSQSYQSGYIMNNGNVGGVNGKHHYCSLDADGIERIIITPPIASAYNTNNLYYVIYIDENGNLTHYAPIVKSTPTIIELNGTATGTIYFNAFTDELSFIYVKEALIIE